MTVAIDEDAAVDVIAQRRVDALSDHHLDTGELDLLVLDPVVVVDHERFHDRVLAPWQSHFAHRVRRRGLGPSLTSHCRIPQQP
jgi:hypothetical protein